MTTATTAIKFKKDADGEWGIIGPADQITAGATIQVAKRNGETSTVTVVSVADEPNDDGTIFAWIAASAPPRPAPSRTSPRRGSTARRGATPNRRRKACVSGGNCSSLSGQHCGGYDCDGN